MLNSNTVIRLRVSEIAKSRGMNITKLVAATSLSRPTASALMKGYSDRLSLETIAKLCEGLDVEPGELFQLER